MSREEGPSPIAPLVGGPVQTVQLMSFSLKAFISHAMDSSMLDRTIAKKSS